MPWLLALFLRPQRQHTAISSSFPDLDSPAPALAQKAACGNVRLLTTQDDLPSQDPHLSHCEVPWKIRHSQVLRIGMRVLEEHYSSYHRNTLCPTWNALNSSRHYLKELREHLLWDSFPDTPSSASFLLPAPTRLDPILRERETWSFPSTHGPAQALVLRVIGFF